MITSHLEDLLHRVGELYVSVAEVMAACIEDGMTAAGAEAYAVELCDLFAAEAALIQEGEIAAENAWLRAAEYDPQADAFEDYERGLGVVPFAEALAAGS